MSLVNVLNSMKIGVYRALFPESRLVLRKFEIAKTETIKTVNRLCRDITRQFNNVFTLDTNGGHLLIRSQGVSRGKMASSIVKTK